MMRLTFVCVAVLAASPAMAGSSVCMAYAHRNAVPWVVDIEANKETPADLSQARQNPAGTIAEVASIEADYRGQEWVFRVHEFAWKSKDVDLKGACRGARSNEE